MRPISDAGITEASAAPITRERIADYGDAVGDHNPVHFDPEFAKAAGLPDTVVHGPFTVAIVLDLLIAQLGGDAVLNLDLRLRGPVFPGESLTVSPADYGIGVHGIEVRNQAGAVVATGVTILEGDRDT